MEPPTIEHLCGYGVNFKPLFQTGDYYLGGMQCGRIIGSIFREIYSHYTTIPRGEKGKRILPSLGYRPHV